jgi:hypothetical protein
VQPGIATFSNAIVKSVAKLLKKMWHQFSLLWELGSNYFFLFGKLTNKVGPSCTRMDVLLGEVYVTKN